MLVSNFDIYGKKVYAKDLSYFAGKHICIIGDSISDNTTNPPNWTVEFTNEVKKVGASVTNLAKNGSSFAAWANNQGGLLTNIPSADIYIVFLGINDFQGQWAWTGGISAYAIRDCMIHVLNHIIQVNNDADYYFISPIKIYRSEVSNYAKPLIYYRALYESVASLMGFTVISGYNAPQLSVYNASKLDGGLHPTSEYGKVLARYILNSIISNVSNFTPFTILVLSNVFKPLAGSGFCTMVADSNFNAQMGILINNFPLSTGWNTICELNDAFTTYPVLMENNVYNYPSNKTYQVQITVDGLQIYSTQASTVNLSFRVNWLNRWNSQTTNI